MHLRLHGDDELGGIASCFLGIYVVAVVEAMGERDDDCEEHEGLDLFCGAGHKQVGVN